MMYVIYVLKSIDFSFFLRYIFFKRNFTLPVKSWIPCPGYILIHFRHISIKNEMLYLSTTWTHLMNRLKLWVTWFAHLMSLPFQSAFIPQNIVTDCLPPAHLFMETALLKIANSVHMTKSNDHLSGWVLLELSVCGHCWSVLLGILCAQNFQTHPLSQLSSLTDRAFPSLSQESFFLFPLRCWFPQSSVLGLPLTPLLWAWSCMLMQVTHQSEEWWPPHCCLWPGLRRVSFTQYLPQKVPSTPQV